MFYLTTHSTHFIYGYMGSDMVKNHSGYSFRLAARVLLYASSHRQDNTYHGRGALAGTRDSPMGPPLFKGRRKKMFYLSTHSTHFI